MMKLIRLLLGLVLTGVLLWTLGCGDDDEGGTMAPPLPRIDIRDGAWLFEAQWDRCDTSFTEVVLDTICEVTAETFENFAGGLPLACELDLVGSDQFTLSCSGSFPLGDCTLVFSASGEGTYTDTMVEGLVALVTTPEGDPVICGSVAACTTWIDITGEWLAAAPCD